MTADREPNESTRDDVATLLRHAGPRPPVPAERLERARRAAHRTWRQGIRSRSNRRNFWAAAALLAAASVLLAVAIQFRPTAGPSVAVSMARIEVDSTIGSVWVEDGSNARRALSSGELIRIGQVVITEPGGRVAFRLPSGHSVRLDQSTRLRALDAVTLAFEQGALYVDSGEGNRAATSLTIQTPLGVVRDIGTQFELRYEAGNPLRVCVREGRVTLNHDGRVHEIPQETAVEVSPAGGISKQAIATDDAGWNWASSIAPMPDLEGHTARKFLDWATRERGWRLAFADATVARAAEETVVVGTVAGMTLDQALDAVLPSCRLEHRLSDGILWISASESGGSRK